MARLSSSSRSRQAMSAASRSDRSRAPSGSIGSAVRFETFRHILERRRTDAADFVERAVAGDGRHPGERRAPRGVEVGGSFPDPDIGLLQRLGGGVLLGQDAEDDAVEFCAGLPVERPKRRLVARRDPAQKVREIALARLQSPARRLRPDGHGRDPRIRFARGATSRAMAASKRAGALASARPPRIPRINAGEALSLEAALR